MSKSTQIVMAVLTSKPNTTPIAFVKRGVANENVVAVAHTTAKIAVTSITLPQKPSTLSPSNGRQASEKRWRSRLRTCIMKPKHTASIT